MRLGFGTAYASQATDGVIDGRYYLNFKGDTLVAMSGVNYNDVYRHLEIDWTCTHPDYRHNGYMQELFTEMLQDVQADVYCSCWRLAGKDHVNLQKVMNAFGFREVLHVEESWQVPHKCFYNCEKQCIGYTGKNCYCYTDLFLRNGDK